MAVYRNANILLLFLILLTFIFIAGTYIFFQKSHEQIYERYSEKTETLKQTQADLSSKYKALQTAEKEITARLKSEEGTAENYKKVLANKQALEAEISALDADIKKLTTELQAQHVATADQKARQQLAEARSGQLKSEIGQYNEDLRRTATLISVVQQEIEQTRKRIQSA